VGSRALRRAAALGVVAALAVPLAGCGRVFGKTSSSASTTLPTLPATTTTTVPPSTTAAGPIDYVIKRGDTMRKIAAKFNTSVDAIMAINPTIKDASKIQAGQRIMIPPPDPSVPTTAPGATDPASSSPPAT
jgi:LysM repeat protein